MADSMRSSRVRHRLPGAEITASSSSNAAQPGFIGYLPDKVDGGLITAFRINNSDLPESVRELLLNVSGVRK